MVEGMYESALGSKVPREKAAANYRTPKRYDVISSGGEQLCFQATAD